MTVLTKRPDGHYVRQHWCFLDEEDYPQYLWGARIVGCGPHTKPNEGYELLHREMAVIHDRIRIFTLARQEFVVGPINIRFDAYGALISGDDGEITVNRGDYADDFEFVAALEDRIMERAVALAPDTQAPPLLELPKLSPAEIEAQITALQRALARYRSKDLFS